MTTTANPTTANKFASEGFDLDAAVSDCDVLELGGGVTQQMRIVDDDDNSNNKSNETRADGAVKKEEEAKEKDPMSEAESHKALGNQYFVHDQNYEKAVESYTLAIQATPGHPTGLELLEMREDWQQEQDRQWRMKLAKVEQERRDEAKKRREASKQQQQASAGTGISSTERSNSGEAATASNNSDKNDEDLPPERPKEVFEPPTHPHGEKLAVYHCNRAAAYLQLQQQEQQQYAEEAARDCDMALLLNPRYLKALGRRATAYERLDKTDLALADVQAALALDPMNNELRQRRDKLQKLEAERLEKLKVETMDKLKDLGNSILGNFGMSLDNFKAVQDPNTGSYSISFQQNS